MALAVLAVALAAPAASHAAEASAPAAVRPVSPQAYILFSEGVALGLRGKHAKAIAKLEQALALDPHSASVLYEIGICHHRLARHGKAAEYLKRSLAIHPGNGPAHEALAFVYAAQSRSADFLRELEAAVRAKVRPQNHEALVRRIAWYYERQGDHASAITWHQFLLECGYRRRETYLALGTLELKARHYGDALGSFREVARRTASDKAAAIGIARAFAALSEKHRDEAIREIEAVAAKATDPATREVLAMAYKAAGRRDDMLRELERVAAALASRRASVQKDYLAEYYEEIGEIAKAIEWRRQLLAQQDPPPAEAFTRLAALYVKHLDMENAAASYRQAMAADPRRHDLLRRIAACHAQLRQWDKAAAALQGFLKDKTLTPVQAETVYELGEIYEQAGNAALAAQHKKQAFDLLTHAVGKRHPGRKLDDVQLHLLIAQLHYAEGRPDKALDYVLVAQQLSPDDPKKWLLVASAHKRVQKWNEAAQALRAYLARDSQSLAAAGALFELAHCQEAAGDLAAAIIAREKAKKLLLKAARATDSDEAKAVIQAQLGEIELRRNRPKAAIERLLDAVRLHPQQAVAHLYLAQACEVLGDWPRAAAYYSTFLESLDGEPHYTDARTIHRLGVAQTRAGQAALGRTNKARAVRLLTTALDTFEKEKRGTPAAKASILRDLAGLHSAQKRYKQAIAAIQRAIALAPSGKRTDCRLTLAAIYQETKRYEDSQNVLLEAYKHDPDNPAVLNHLGYFYAERRAHLDQAVALVQKALERDPLNGAYIDSLGWAYYQQGKHREALDLLRRAVQYEEDAVIRDHIGDVCHKLGRTKQAREAWLKALTLDPDIEGVAEKLKNTSPAKPTPPKPQPALKPKPQDRPAVPEQKKPPNP